MLSNAIKYNRPGGRVDVSFRSPTAGRVRTTIADTGIGIAARAARQAVRAVRAARRRAHRGRRHRPRARAVQRADRGDGRNDRGPLRPGIGTTFTIELAGAERPARRARARPARSSAGRARRPRRQARRLILYIEDNLSNLTLVERILRATPRVELIPAMQGDDRARARTRAPPRPDRARPAPPRHAGHRGPHAPQRRTSTTREIPVIVLTADASKGQSERVRAARSGRLPDQTPRRPQIPRSHRRQSRRTTRLIFPAAGSWLKEARSTYPALDNGYCPIATLDKQNYVE